MGGERAIVLMYAPAAEREAAPARQRDLLQRAGAYTQPTLRDYQHYQRRAAADEVKAQSLLEMIEEDLAKLP